MAKEILIYSPIFDFTAEEFITQLNDMNDADVTVRVNSPGGSVFAGWGMIAKSKEYKGKMTIKVDGNASSMAAIFLLFHKNVEALSVSTFTLHRASIFMPTPEDLLILDQINSDIRSAFEAKLDVAAFEKIAGVTMDEFFNSKEVIDVNINAKQAKQIGLISKINELDAQAFTELSAKIAAISFGAENTNKNNNQKPNKMNIEQLKNEHPAVFAQVIELGKKEGIIAERDRVGSWMAFGDVDFVAVKKAIVDGDTLSQTAMAEFSRKSFAAQTIAKVEEESAGAVETESEKTTEPTAIDVFMTEFKTLNAK